MSFECGACLLNKTPMHVACFPCAQSQLANDMSGAQAALAVWGVARPANASTAGVLLYTSGGVAQLVGEELQPADAKFTALLQALGFNLTAGSGRRLLLALPSKAQAQFKTVGCMGTEVTPVSSMSCSTFARTYCGSTHAMLYSASSITNAATLHAGIL